MFCNNCGNNCPDGTAFCTNCGSPLNTQSAQPTFTEITPETSVYTQPDQTMYEQPAQTDGSVPGNGLGIAALILGIISLANLNFVAGIVGLVLANKSLAAAAAAGMTNSKASTGRKLSIAGIIVGSIALVLFIIIYIAYIAILVSFSTGGYYY